MRKHQGTIERCLGILESGSGVEPPGKSQRMDHSKTKDRLTMLCVLSEENLVRSQRNPGQMTNCGTY